MIVSLIIRLLLQDTAAYAGGSATGDPVVVLSEGFERPRSLFSISTSGCNCAWTRVISDAYSGEFSFFVEDAPAAGMGSLTLPASSALAIPANATAATMSFWQRLDLEFGIAFGMVFSFDGGVFEISTDGGSTWSDGGAHVMSGGYNGTIADVDHGNPLVGRDAWVNRSHDWQQVVIDLMPFRGQRFQFRLRLGLDVANDSEARGWWIDDLAVTYTAPLAACTRTWSEAPAYPIRAEAAAAVGLGSSVYVFGGGGESAVANAYRYSPISGWTPLASLPEPRSGARAVTDGTSIYIVGGSFGTLRARTLWRYDPAANNYTTLAPSGVGSSSYAVGYLDGFLYRIGGSVDGNAIATAEAYSLAGNSWSTIANYPAQLIGISALSLGGHLYTAGGFIESFTSRKTYRYNPGADFWDDGPIADLPGPVATLSGAFYNGTWVLQRFDLPIGWDPGLNSWRSLDQIPQDIGLASVAATNDALYLIGGIFDAPTTVVHTYREINCGSGSTCIGDCDGDGDLTIADLVKGVHIVLGRHSLEDCSEIDADADGTAYVDDVVQAVNNAADDCATP